MIVRKFHSVSSFALVIVIGALALAGFAAIPPVADAAGAEVVLSFAGLEDLGPGWAYEGWLIVDGAPVSTGVFTVDGNGVASATSFAADVADMSQVSAFVLTVEPSPDADPGPSAVHVLGGDFVDGVASLTAAHGAALGSDFSSAAGSYILNAPSAGEGGAYVNGIWWLDPAAGPGPSLDLPALPSGWVYEGWVVGMDGPVSTGRFTFVSGVDSDGAGPAAGSSPAPPFPGQDFVNPSTDLTAGYAAVISIEPEPDNSSGPFTFKPLVDMSIDDVGAGVLQAMDNNASTSPTGTAAFGDTMMAEGEMAPESLPETGAANDLSLVPLAAMAAGLLMLALGMAFALGWRLR